jgi:hypothetical protein
MQGSHRGDIRRTGERRLHGLLERDRRRNHLGWIYDGSGNLAGYFNETETDELSKDGNSYSGNNETKVYDLTGAIQVDVKGTASAKRIFP